MPPLDFSQLTGPPQSIANLYAPDPTQTGTADMTVPNSIYSPGPAQPNLTAPDDLAGMRAASGQGQPQPIYTGIGGYRDTAGAHPASTKRKLGAALLSLIAGPEAGQEVLTQPYQADLHNWAANEAQRQKQIEESKNLATTAAAVGREGAQTAYYNAESEWRKAESHRQARLNQPPDPEELASLGKSLGKSDEWANVIRTIKNPSVLGAVQQGLIANMTAEAKKPDETDMRVMAPLWFQAYPGMDSTDPAVKASTDQLLQHMTPTMFAEFNKRLDSMSKPASEASLDKQDADLTAKVMAGTATPQEKLQLKAIRDARTRVPAATFNLNNPVPTADIVRTSVDTLKQNPDAVTEVMKEAKGNAPLIQKQFTQETGLPMPQALKGTAVDQERAARNALDGANFINDALKNPEIRAQIGPIMGRLGNAEQAIGTAHGLSPQAEQLAQELRTRMRYFVFQEGRAILSGRMPAQLMQQLETSSASVKMDPNMLQGALKGATDNALSVLDNSDKQRFGGKMRSRADRGLPEIGTPTRPNGVPSDAVWNPTTRTWQSK